MTVIYFCKRFNKLLNKVPPDYSMSHKQNLISSKEKEGML